MNLPEITIQCCLACEAEAVKMGFSANAGRDIYEGCVKDDLENWSKERFLGWVTEIQFLYGKTSRTGYALMTLYSRVNEIMGEYGQMISNPNLN